MGNEKKRNGTRKTNYEEGITREEYNKKDHIAGLLSELLPALPLRRCNWKRQKEIQPSSKNE